jgi:hypothetical protein
MGARRSSLGRPTCLGGTATNGKWISVNTATKLETRLLHVDEWEADQRKLVALIKYALQERSESHWVLRGGFGRGLVDCDDPPSQHHSTLSIGQNVTIVKFRHRLSD